MRLLLLLGMLGTLLIFPRALSFTPGGVAGVRRSHAALATVVSMAQGSQAETEERIYDLAGHKFNLRSGAALSNVLFKEQLLSVPVDIAKGADGRFPVTSDVLQQIYDDPFEGNSEIVKCILEWRELTGDHCYEDDVDAAAAEQDAGAEEQVAGADTKPVQLTEPVASVDQASAQLASGALSTTPDVMLVDGTHMVFRSFHAMPPLTASDGTPIGALAGFCNSLSKVLSPIWEADAKVHVTFLRPHPQRTSLMFD
ncbi:unnamed protein product [Chrysoparadoxa australica]